MRRQGKRASRSQCGVYDCSACALYSEQRCPGCASGNLHLRREGQAPCPVYECVRVLRIAGCHECEESRCRLRAWSRVRCPLRTRLGGEQAEGFRAMLEGAKGVAAAARRETALPERSAERMRWYLQVVEEYADRGVTTVSSHHLARATGARSTLVRRDLARLGRFGVPGRGYGVRQLRAAIRRRLKLERTRPTVWLGAVHLAESEAASAALRAVNCRLVGLYDDTCEARRVAGVSVQPLKRAAQGVRSSQAVVAVLAAEEAARPELVKELVAAGIRGVLNLTSAPLPASAQAVIEQGDLGTQLCRLLSRLARVREAGENGF